ncbi:hypothetical protein Efla_000481 [Eimeria flavescens]
MKGKRQKSFVRPCCLRPLAAAFRFLLRCCSSAAGAPSDHRSRWFRSRVEVALQALPAHPQSRIPVLLPRTLDEHVKGEKKKPQKDNRKRKNKQKDMKKKQKASFRLPRLPGWLYLQLSTAAAATAAAASAAAATAAAATAAAASAAAATAAAASAAVATLAAAAVARAAAGSRCCCCREASPDALLLAPTSAAACN